MAPGASSYIIYIRTTAKHCVAAARTLRVRALRVSGIFLKTSNWVSFSYLAFGISAYKSLLECFGDSRARAWRGGGFDFQRGVGCKRFCGGDGQRRHPWTTTLFPTSAKLATNGRVVICCSYPIMIIQLTEKTLDRNKKGDIYVYLCQL